MDNNLEVPLESTQNSPMEESLNNEEESDGACSPSSGRSSPELNCPICLDKLKNKSFTDSCLHQFCFSCLLDWSRVKAECPLCKQGFKSIIHSVRSIEDYEQYYLNTAPTPESFMDVFMIDGDPPNREGQPFRYRTTRTTAVSDYFVGAVSHHVLPRLSTYSAPIRSCRRHQHGTSDSRRNIYQQGLWVQRIMDFEGRFRESSPEFYRSNPAQVHRLVPWLNRELNVLCGENQVQEVITLILDLITRIPIRSSQFNFVVAPYIGRHTEHFVHEFYTFATSPFDLIGYDRHANYVNQDIVAHEVMSEQSNDGHDSDIQIVGPSTPTTYSIQLDSSSDSDDCVVIDCIPPRLLSPEVITLESDEDDNVVRVNISIDSGNNRPGPSRKLKRNWLSVQNVEMPTPRSKKVNVSINIARVKRTQSISVEETPSRSTPSPCTKKTSDTKVEKGIITKKTSETKVEKGIKAKKMKKNKKLKHKKKPILSSSDDDSPAPSRHKQSVALKPSTNDGDSVYSVLPSGTDDYSSSNSDDPDYKPRLRSVVIKPETKVKPEPCSLSPLHSTFSFGSESHRSNSGTHDYNYRNYPTFNPDVPGCSNMSWSDTYRCYSDVSRTSLSDCSLSSERVSYKKCKRYRKKSKK